MSGATLFGSAMLTPAQLRFQMYGGVLVHVKRPVRSSGTAEFRQFIAAYRARPPEYGSILLFDSVLGFMAHRHILFRKDAVIICDSPIMLAELNADVVPLDYDISGDSFSLASTLDNGNVTSKAWAAVIEHLLHPEVIPPGQLATFAGVERSVSPRLEAVISLVSQNSGNLLSALNALTFGLQAADRDKLRNALTRFLVGPAAHGKQAIADIRRIASANDTLDAPVEAMAKVLSSEGPHYRALVSPRAAASEKRRLVKQLGISQFEVRFLESLVGSANR